MLLEAADCDPREIDLEGFHLRETLRLRIEAA